MYGPQNDPSLKVYNPRKINGLDFEETASNQSICKVMWLFVNQIPYPFDFWDRLLLGQETMTYKRWFE